ncbi:MAG TPA: FG-GAP-like repeat-containing protein, partial [Chitinophagaceae bacterium]|nr:FG-GAP-like repeat-containing protein [Chitinophagaceae bacterium]
MKGHLATAAFCLIASTLFSQPKINSFSPASGPVATAVTIKGTGFNTTAANNTVYFGAVKAVVTSSTDTTVFVTVPAGASYQPISVTNNNLTGYSTLPFVVTFAGGGSAFTSTSFLPKADFTTGNYPHCALTADFNDDGKADIIVSRGSSSDVSVLKNTSSGTTISFASAALFAATGNNHEGAATADFDGDGKIDFVITNSNGLNSVS